jgi:steroid 5-alpha reductase family enzyme
VTGWGDLALVSGASLLALAVLMAVTALVAQRVGRVSVVDVTWGLCFVVVAVVGLALGTGELSRRALLVVLVGAWGLRLAWHIWRRSRGKGEDPRYAEMLDEAPGSRMAYAVRKVFLVQGLAAWFISLPVQVAAVAEGGLGWVAVGLSFEAVGDRQLAAFKADPANRGKVMDRGLWGWTRHPNYFGDACVWWGIFLVSADAWPGVLTVLSPVVMTYFLVWGTGAKLLERSMAQRPAYREYMERTSAFLPLPPGRT